MAAEHDNLRAALEWARDSDEDEVLLRLTAALGIHWRMTRPPQTGSARAGSLSHSNERRRRRGARMDVLRMLSAVALWQERDYAQRRPLVAEWRRHRGAGRETRSRCCGR